MSKEQRVIFHIDLDAFFASCEERENPQFRGKPIVVGADPKNGKGRGVVSTANYAARKFGIHSAMPISQAWRICPHAVFLPVNGALYSRVSNSVMAILKNTALEYNGKFEQVSIDEAYIDLSQHLLPCTSARKQKHAGEIAKKIKKEICRKENVSASVGVGPNILIAKIASDFEKPNGLTIVNPEDVQKFLDPLAIRKLPGIGPKTESELKKLYVGSPTSHIGWTVGDLRRIPQPVLYETFGQHGISLYEGARGTDDGVVGEETETKSISEEHTFERDTNSAQEILPVLFELTKSVLKTASTNGYRNFRTITIRVRYADFKTHTKSLSGIYSTQNSDKIEKTVLKLLWPFLSYGKKVRLIGFRMSRFT